jgi:hypothetical protein
MGWFSRKTKVVPVINNKKPVKNSPPVNHKQYNSLMRNHKNKILDAIKKHYLFKKNKTTRKQILIKNISEITPETYKNIIGGTYTYYQLYHPKETLNNVVDLLNRIISNQNKEQEKEIRKSFVGPANINRNNSLTEEEKRILRALYNNSIKINGINLNSARKVKHVTHHTSARNGNYKYILNGSALYNAYRSEAKRLASK